MSDYDPNNIFAKILRDEIPHKKIYEDEHVFAFHDAFPKKKVHALIVPKGPYKDMNDAGEIASDVELAALLRAVPKVVELLKIKDSGYRVISNIGTDGGQEVPHLHLHILGGEKIGRMVE